MIPAGHLLAFAVAAFVLIAIPGPSVLFVVSRGMALGRRAAVATVIGNCAGVYVQVAAVALGIGAIVERSAAVFTVIKLVGAAYLVVLGIRMFRQRRALAKVLDVAATPKSTLRIVREGFTVGVTNPKSMVFLAAILPQFTDPKAGHEPLQILVLGLIFVLIAFVSDSTWGIAAGTARRWLSRSPRRMELVGGTGGLVVIGLGVGLALTGRKS